MEQAGVLNTNNPIHIETLRFCFGPLMKNELNMVEEQWNLHRVRKQYWRGICGGKPNILYYLPEMFNAVDCSKPVEEDHIDRLLYSYATEPKLYEPRFKTDVADALIPTSKTPCTAKEAYDLYLKLTSKINVERRSWENFNKVLNFYVGCMK